MSGESGTRSSWGPWLVIAAGALWGTTGTAQAFAPAGAQSSAIGALRLLVGGAALLALALLRRGFGGGAGWPRLPTAIAAAGVAGYQLLFFTAVARSGVALGTIVGIGSAPVWSGTLAWLLERARPSGRWILSTAFAIAGAAALLGAGSRLQVDVPGLALALGAGAAYALYAQASKGLLRRHSPDAVMAVVFGLGAVLLLPILFASDLRWLAQPRGLTVVLHLGLIATAASYVLFSRGLRMLPAATAVTLSMAEPLTAGALGFLVLGERLAPLAMLGAGSLLAGLLLLALAPGAGATRPGQHE